MYAVIFEVWPTAQGQDEYLKIAAELREFLESRDGFISIERFQSMADESKILSLSFWRDEAAIAQWRNFSDHRTAQQLGRKRLFDAYRIRVANVVRDYTQSDRGQTPADSQTVIG